MSRTTESGVLTARAIGPFGTFASAAADRCPVDLEVHRVASGFTKGPELAGKESVIVVTVRPRRDRQASGGQRVSREDRRRLSRHREGQLHYQTGRGPRCLAVTYAVAGDYVLLRLPEYNDLGHYAPGRPVVLEVFEPDHSLQVEGVAQVAGPQHQALIERTRFPEAVPAGVASRVICLPLAGLSPMPRRSWSRWGRRRAR